MIVHRSDGKGRTHTVANAQLPVTAREILAALPPSPPARRRRGTLDGMEHTESEGGEPACWLNLVCEECGKVRERGHCPVCEPEQPDASAKAPDSAAPQES